MAKLQATENMYQLLKRPLVTEKTARLAEGNWIVFEVEKQASKPDIRSAVERLYGVDVLQVNTLIQKGKAKGAGRIAGKRSDVKKAFIKLKEGQSVDMAAGL